MGNKIMRLAVKYLVDEANKRGIAAEMLDKDHFILNYQGHTEYFDETLCSITTSTAVEFCFNKYLTKVFLTRSGIETPNGGVFSDKNEAIGFASKLNWPIVAKPCYGVEGNLVFANIKNIKQFEIAWDKITKLHELIIIEERFSGEEYRVFSTRNKAISVVKRVPANVVGDGAHTIRQLIEIKNQDSRRQPGMHPLAKIIVDEIVELTLSNSNLTLDLIPKNKEQVFLRENSNISTGGDSVECSEIAHPSVFEIALKAVNSIPGLSYGGVDFMTLDITKEQKVGQYSIIEINSQPGLALHQDPAKGKAVDIAKEIIDLVFPETIS